MTHPLLVRAGSSDAPTIEGAHAIFPGDRGQPDRPGTYSIPPGVLPQAQLPSLARGVRHALEALNGSARGDAHVSAFHRASASIKHGKWTVRNTINML